MISFTTKLKLVKQKHELFRLLKKPIPQVGVQGDGDYIAMVPGGELFSMLEY